MLKTYVNEELELDMETLTLLKELAEKHNSTLDEVVNEILIENVSTKITIDECIKILQENNHEKISNYYTIVDNDQKHIARIIPLR